MYIKIFFFHFCLNYPINRIKQLGVNIRMRKTNENIENYSPQSCSKGATPVF